MSKPGGAELKEAGNRDALGATLEARTRSTHTPGGHSGQARNFGQSLTKFGQSLAKVGPTSADLDTPMLADFGRSRLNTSTIVFVSSLG